MVVACRQALMLGVVCTVALLLVEACMLALLEEVGCMLASVGLHYKLVSLGSFVSGVEHKIGVLLQVEEYGPRELEESYQTDI